MVPVFCSLWVFSGRVSVFFQVCLLVGRARALSPVCLRVFGLLCGCALVSLCHILSLLLLLAFGSTGLFASSALLTVSLLQHCPGCFFSTVSWRVGFWVSLAVHLLRSSSCLVLLLSPLLPTHSARRLCMLFVCCFAAFVPGCGDFVGLLFLSYAICSSLDFDIVLV